MENVTILNLQYLVGKYGRQKGRERVREVPHDPVGGKSHFPCGSWQNGTEPQGPGFRQEALYPCRQDTWPK